MSKGQDAKKGLKKEAQKMNLRSYEFLIIMSFAFLIILVGCDFLGETDGYDGYDAICIFNNEKIEFRNLKKYRDLEIWDTRYKIYETFYAHEMCIITEVEFYEN